MRTSIGTETWVSIRFAEQEKENNKMVATMKQNTKHTYEYGDECI